MYAEYASIRRHVLQVSATGEKDLLQKMEDHATGEWVDGLQVSDDDRPLLIHAPYGSLEVGRNEDGPAIFAGNVFGDDDVHWLRDLARELLRLADEREEGRPKVELMEKGIVIDEDCPKCDYPEIGASLTLDKPSERLVYKRCSHCGWQRNLGYFGDDHTVVQAILGANAPESTSTP